MIGSLGYSGAAGELNKRGTVVYMELVHQHLHSHLCSFCPRELIVDDGPSSRVLNESWAGGGKISSGWDSVQPNSHSLVSASWDSTIKNCKNWNCHCDGLHTCQKSLASHHQFLAHMTLKTLPRSQVWIGKMIMSLDLGFLLFDSIFKMIYPPNHSEHMSLHRKALTL